MKNPSPNTGEKNLVKKDYTFVAVAAELNVFCPVCGIHSFSHFHKKGTIPRDFIRGVEGTKPSQQCLCHCHDKFCGVLSPIPKTNTTCEHCIPRPSQQECSRCGQVLTETRHHYCGADRLKQCQPPKQENPYGDHETHYACDEMLQKYGDKTLGCCCSGHKCKPAQSSEWEVSFADDFFGEIENYQEVKSFIKSLLSSQRKELRERVIKAGHRDGYDVEVVFLDDILEILK